MASIPKSENGGLAVELAAAVSRAREALETFRTEDEGYVRGRVNRPDYVAHAHAMAASLYQLLRLIDPKENDDVDRDDV